MHKKGSPGLISWSIHPYYSSLENKDLHKNKDPKENKFLGWGLKVPNQILYAMNKEGLK
jgi:hypothetical protein